MSKPLKETFWARVYRLFYGMVFYNTVYWQRASDGLKPPKLTREERLQSRPTPVVAVIKPRVNPRAKLESIENATVEVSVPLVNATGTKLQVPEVIQNPDSASAPVEASTGELIRTRVRKKKRRQIRQHMPRGFFARWFD